MALAPELIHILRCPQSGQRLREADADELAALRASIAAGALGPRDGDASPDALEAALIREDGEAVYPVVDGIPNLLLEDALWRR